MSKVEVIYEDNHLIAVNKTVHDLVQGDKTGDETLADKVKKYIKEKYSKPGDVYLGIIHRLDRPTSGIVLFARTSKALSRMNAQFREKETKKTYWAIVQNRPQTAALTLKGYLKKNEKQNKSYCHNTEVKGSKYAELYYSLISSSDNYHLLEIDLKTGRHHQIRTQLASINCPIKGDLKYGSPRSNKDGGICLHARKLEFDHPVKKEEVSIVAPTPMNDSLWQFFEEQV